MYPGCPSHNQNNDESETAVDGRCSLVPASERGGGVNYLAIMERAGRMNATIEVIERHDDQASQLAEFRERRAAHLHKLGIEGTEAHV
jgi:hypothetical protein